MRMVLRRPVGGGGRSSQSAVGHGPPLPTGSRERMMAAAGGRRLRQSLQWQSLQWQSWQQLQPTAPSGRSAWGRPPRSWRLVADSSAGQAGSAYGTGAGGGLWRLRGRRGPCDSGAWGPGMQAECTVVSADATATTRPQQSCLPAPARPRFLESPASQARPYTRCAGRSCLCQYRQTSNHWPPSTRALRRNVGQC